jgi:hypothetical protein
VSNPPKVILLDSNAYFRLARSIRPLLAPTFGPPPHYSLFVLYEVDTEYFRSPRLKTKFEWVNCSEFRNDREAKRYKSAGKNALKVEHAFSFLASYVKAEGLNVSREDLKALAIGFVRGIPVVSDDKGMRQTADAHGIEYWPALKLLKLMVTEARITLELVHEILQYLDHENDLPMSKENLRAEYSKYFDGNCPL